uniref:Spen paralogue and orthologue SPOC C-terminal domain-containing protein n=1 Tax=Rhodosorus marinus TaxID=101924 RepID=A0A7S0BT13_9RHOD|mmetsp:Transcript_8134/g.12062  ORF Transcript_8134/g.12062 Transcript_8134/m.12062 type:complete len:367 (+) Transcript_8134:366-1466(+)
MEDRYRDYQDEQYDVPHASSIDGLGRLASMGSDRLGGYPDDPPTNHGPGQHREGYKIQGEEPAAYGTHIVDLVDDPVQEGGNNGVFEGKRARQEPEHERTISLEEQEQKNKYDLMRNNLVHRDRARNSEIARPQPRVEERVERRPERRPIVWSGVVKDGNLPSLRVKAFFLEGNNQLGSFIPDRLSVLGRTKLGDIGSYVAAVMKNSSTRDTVLTYINPGSARDEKRYWTMCDSLREKERAALALKDSSTEVYLIPPGSVAAKLHEKGSSRLLGAIIVRRGASSRGRDNGEAELSRRVKDPRSSMPSDQNSGPLHSYARARSPPPQHSAGRYDIKRPQRFPPPPGPASESVDVAPPPPPYPPPGPS